MDILETLVEMMISLEQIELREEELLEREFQRLEMNPTMEFAKLEMDPTMEFALLEMDPTMEFAPLEMDPMMEFMLMVMNPEKDLELLTGEVLIELVEQKGSCATKPELLEKRLERKGVLEQMDPELMIEQLQTVPVELILDSMEEDCLLSDR